MSYIEFTDIYKTFGNLEVLKGISLEVEEGEFVSLLGPSGCGKSTLLRCFAGLEEVTSGFFMLDGTDITDLSPQKRNIGMVFQQYSLFPNMTVSKNLSFGLEIKKIEKKERESRIEKALELVGLQDKKNAYPATLSGGQQQRVALARALVTEPKVLLLDEPFSAIDAKLRKNLQVEIRKIQKQLNITTVFVTHDQDEAMLMSDRICLIDEGVISQIGTPIDIYTKPSNRFAAGFIGHYNLLSVDEFQKIAPDVRVGQCDQVAIRPETITLSKERIGNKDSIELECKILSSRSVGNVLRYHILANEIELRVDTLFRSFTLYPQGEKLWMSVEKRNCLEIV